VGKRVRVGVVPAGLSLAKLRSQATGQTDPVALRQLRDRLRGDPRSGARELAASLGRRLAAIRRERRRLERLFVVRQQLFDRGLRRVAGIDEVGVGPLAGPVVAAAVVLPDVVDLPGLNDSKRLTRRSRERLDAIIREQGAAIGIGEVSPADIDRINILQATLLAMRRAVAALGQLPDHLLVDARTIPQVQVEQTALVGGDASDGSIAAASIVAKVHRDALMRRLDDEHPGYGFSSHMGYGTPQHLAALRRLGASPIHRRSFQPVANVVGG
jgi:ribonuclease HII